MQEAGFFGSKYGKWPSQEDAIVDSKSKVQIHSATLVGSEAENLLKILYDFDITPSRLMPSLDNVAKSFEYEHTLFN